MKKLNNGVYFVEAFGYEVYGSKKVVEDVEACVRHTGWAFNWNNWKSGEPYFTEEGARYLVIIDHEAKQVALM